jgi:uncharacterized protein YggE
MKAFLATLCTLLLTGIASADVNVSGEGKVTYVPDLAHVTVGVSADGKTAQEAWRNNSAIVQKLFEVLKANGIDARDMQTSGLNVSPRYTHPKDQEPVLIGYTVTYDLHVTVRKLNELGKVLDGLVENGANRQTSISFGCADPEKLLNEARLKAVADARKKAELYVTAAGASLGPVLSISDSQAIPVRTLQYEHLAKAADAPMPIVTGEQEMTVTVTLVYAIDRLPVLPTS